MKSIKLRIMLSIAVLIVVICAGFSLSSILTSSNTLRSNVDETLPQFAKQASLLVESRIQEQFNTLDALAKNATLYDTKVPWTVKKELLSKIAAEKSFKFLGISDTHGNAKVALGKADSNEATKQLSDDINISDRAYFKNALLNKNTVTDPLVNKNDGTLVIAFAVPIKEGNTVTGVLFAVRDGNEISSLTDDITYGKSGKAFIINTDGYTIAHSNRELVLNRDNVILNLAKDPTLAQLAALEKKMAAGESGTGLYTDNGVEKFIAYTPIISAHWSIGISAPREEIFSQLSTLRQWIIILTMIFLLLGLVTAYFISIQVADPIMLLSKHLGVVAEGDFSQPIPERIMRFKHEIGKLGLSVDTMQSSVREIIANIQIESRNVNQAIDYVNANISDLNVDIEDISATTEELSAGMEQTAAAAQEMNAASIEIENAIESISLKSQEGAESTSKVSERANTLKVKAISSKEYANKTITEANERLKHALEQSKAVEQINVLSVAILQITSQTNLLALNAAIEAARAGDAGKGFSVVAEEIRKLAEDSAKSANEIQQVSKTVMDAVKSLSDSSQSVIEFIETNVQKDYKSMVQTSDQYNQDSQFVGDIINGLSSTSKDLAAFIQNMIRAINEISTAAGEGAEGTTSIATKGASAAAKSNEVIIMAEQAKECMKRLQDTISRFRI